MPSRERRPVEPSRRWAARSATIVLLCALLATLAAVASGQAPTVINTAPHSGETLVSTTDAVIVFFSEGMNQNSVSAAFSLLDASRTSVVGTTSWLSASSMAFAPKFNLLGHTWYTIVLSGAAQSLNGVNLKPFTSNFSTAAAEPAPLVEGTAPEAFALEVPVNTNVTLQFSVSMEPDATDAAISLAPLGGAAVGLTTFWSGDLASVLCVPSASLAAGTVYVVSVSVAATSEAGEALSLPFNSTFQTAPGPPSPAPPPSQRNSTMWLLISLTVVVAIVAGGVLAGLVFAYRSRATIDTFAFVDEVPDAGDESGPLLAGGRGGSAYDTTGSAAVSASTSATAMHAAL